MSVNPELLHKWKIQAITRDRLHVVLLVIVHLLDEIAPDCDWEERVTDQLQSSMEVSLSALHILDDWYRQQPWKGT